MAPEVRVYYPSEQRESLDIAIAHVPGTRILSRKEFKPIAIDQVSSNKLALFMKESKGIDVPRISYQSIFSALQPLSLEDQSGILASFLTEAVEEFPNPQAYAEFIARINSIHWLRPTQEPDPVAIRERCEIPKSIEVVLLRDWKNVYVEGLAFYIPEIPMLNEELDNKPLRYLSYSTTQALSSNARKDIEQSIKDSGIEIPNNIRHHHARRISMRIRRELRASLANQMLHPNEENPYEPLLEIYDQGGWPIGKQGEEYLVFYPKIAQLKTE